MLILEIKMATSVTYTCSHSKLIYPTGLLHPQSFPNTIKETSFPLGDDFPVQGLAQFQEELALFFGQIGGGADLKGHDLIAPAAGGAIAAEAGDAFTPDADIIAGLGPGGNRHHLFAIQGWHFDLIAQGCLGDIDG